MVKIKNLNADIRKSNADERRFIVGNICDHLRAICGNPRSRIVVFLCTFFFSTTICLAKDITFEATVDKNRVSLGDSLELHFSFHGTQEMPAPEPPQIDGFESRYLGPSTMMSIVNGRVSSSITHNYTLMPLRKGTFTLGPFSFQYRNDTYTSAKPINIEVVEGPIRPPSSGQIAPQPESVSATDLGDRVFLVIEPEKARAYLNEPLQVTIKLYVNRLGIRDIQYPNLPHEGFSIGNFVEPKQYQEVRDGALYDAIEFSTKVFGTRPGEFKLGPADLKCNLIVKRERGRRPSSFFGEDIFDDFFGRYQTYPLNLKSEAVTFTILPLPEEGRPGDFEGAVGDFTLNVEAQPKEVKVGDPITLKMVVSGNGNFSSVTPPKLSSEAGFKVYEPQAKEVDGAKNFEQVLMPMQDSVKEISEIQFSFFDTRAGVYRTLRAGPIPIKVSRPEKEETLKIIEASKEKGEVVKSEILGRDIIYIKDSPGRFRAKGAYLYKKRGFILMQVLPISFLLAIFVFHKRRERLKTDTKYARRLRAPKKAKRGLQEARRMLAEDKRLEFFNTLFKTLQVYLGDKFHMPSGGISASFLDEFLKPRGVDEEILNKLRELFRDCDMARYAPAEFDKDKMQTTLAKLEKVIGYFERTEI